VRIEVVEYIIRGIFLFGFLNTFLRHNVIFFLSEKGKIFFYGDVRMEIINASVHCQLLCLLVVAFLICMLTSCLEKYNYPEFPGRMYILLPDQLKCPQNKWWGRGLALPS
jgi:hypothetical protein